MLAPAIDPAELSLSLKNNPYLQSKVLWNDMYGGVESKLKTSQRLNLLLVGLIALSLFGLIHIAGLSKIKPMPFIVHGNEVLTVNERADHQIDALKPQLASYFAKLFIRRAREVSVDYQVNQTNRVQSFAFVSGAASNELKSYYQAGRGVDNVSNRLINVTITSVLRKSNHAFVIRWREDSRSIKSGELIQSRNYIGELTYQYDTPSTNASILENNPLGFYITQLSWSRDINPNNYQ